VTPTAPPAAPQPAKAPAVPKDVNKLRPVFERLYADQSYAVTTRDEEKLASFHTVPYTSEGKVRNLKDIKAEAHKLVDILDSLEKKIGVGVRFSENTSIMKMQLKKGDKVEILVRSTLIMRNPANGARFEKVMESSDTWALQHNGDWKICATGPSKDISEKLVKATAQAEPAPAPSYPQNNYSNGYPSTYRRPMYIPGQQDAVQQRINAQIMQQRTNPANPYWMRRQN
jgi:hypothetical protein